jgi:hypothetical protein
VALATHDDLTFLSFSLVQTDEDRADRCLIACQTMLNHAIRKCKYAAKTVQQGHIGRNDI